MTDQEPPTRLRREPPPLVPITVVDRVELSPRMVRLTFEGEGLRSFAPPDPAASVRLLVPSPGADLLVLPEWNGNEFLLPDGTRPALRTFTPRRLDRDAGRIDLEIVRHPGGAVAGWAETAQPGSAAALSGPGKGYLADPDASRFLLLGDETALPAIEDLLESIPETAEVEVHLEIDTAAAQIPLPDHPGRSVLWHVRLQGDPPGHELVEVVRNLDRLEEGTRLWAAGEAAAMHAIRGHLFQTLEVPRNQATVRGYWKAR